MSYARGRLVFAFLFVLNCILWSRGRYAHPVDHLRPARVGLVKRMSYELTGLGAPTHLITQDECRPLAFPPDQQCAHVQAHCAKADTVLGIDYLRLYFCTEPHIRPFVFTGFVAWLVFLFSTLGISASDFFTPNLHTISTLLGLDENVAGVTFLAFGNGSPDVFSTFSAMRVGSGSLAIGELLGAATFIVSCVVGSMCVIAPFHVQRGPFLRDVGFFTVAVSVVLIILWDGKISNWEAASLVVVYVIYVCVVVGSSYYERRRARLRAIEDLRRSEYAEPDFEPYQDEPLPTPIVSPTPSRARAISAPTPPRIQTSNLHPHARTRSSSPVSPQGGIIPSFSLVGALEFREVVAGLKSHAATNSLEIFNTPVTPYAGGHYHPHPPSRPHSPRSSLHSSMDEETLSGLQLERTRRRTPSGLSQSVPDIMVSDYFNSNHAEQEEAPPTTQPHPHPAITIMRTPASPTSDNSSSDTEILLPTSKRQRFLAVVTDVWHTLFPTLRGFWGETALTKLARLLATPAVTGLTLTLPVVYTSRKASSSSGKKYEDISPLVDIDGSAVLGERDYIAAEDMVEASMHELPFKKWLMAVQCVCGPLFAVKVLFDGTEYERWIALGTLLGGSVVAGLVMLLAERANSVSARMARSSMGFIVAIVWIMAIADEVVDVLEVFGQIFGLSDAIIGLTIFAVGNSLADLVANMTVASSGAPNMGFAACFGGPMLNILLGIGGSGSYVINQTSEPYIINLSTTLFVSAFGLLFLLFATLIVVPYNNYHLSKQWGLLLIGTYTVIMIINIVVEWKS